MAATPITVSELTQVGRTNVGDAPRPRITLSYQADFTSAADISFNFSNQEANTFGYAKSIFVDNSTNPSPVVIIVSTTQHKFTIPAYSEGVYQIETSVACTIRMTTDGGATDNKATINFYNYVVPPQVYYSFGPFNSSAILKMQGAMNEGSDIPSQTASNDPVYIGGKDGSNVLRGLKTDATGRLEVIGSASGGVVYGPDVNGSPPTQPPVLIAGFDGANVRSVRVTATGYLQVEGSVTGGGVLTPTGSGMVGVAGTDGTNARILQTDSGGALQVIQKNSTAYTRTSVNGATSSTIILASNSSRRSVKLFNDSTATLYLGFGSTAVSTSNYSLQILPGGYYEVPAPDSGSELRGIWSAANGAVKVTTGI